MGRRGFVVIAGAALAIALTAPASAGEKITIGGASGMIPIAQELAKAFGTKTKGDTVEIEAPTSSPAGIKSLQQGKLDIALSSRTLTGEETAQGLQLKEFARVRVVLAVNKSVPVKNITSEQVCGIYAGRIKNWREVGGPERPLFPLTRPSSETDPQILRANIECFKNLKEAETVLIMMRAADMAQALATKEGTFGYTTMIEVGKSEGRIVPLSLNGVEPSRENVAKGTYKLIRNFFFVLPAKPKPLAQSFVDFVLSADGEKIIRAQQALPAK
jgi:phosphate transport system substrate-binding protein